MNGRRSIAAAAAVLCAITLAGCASSSSPAVPIGPTPTPTPIVAVELTSSPSGAPGSVTPASSGGDCLALANGTAMVGQPCLQGTEEIAYDVTELPNAHETIHTVSPVHIGLSLWAVAPGVLKGTAHLAFSVISVSTDSQATTCRTTTEKVDPLTWDVELDGQYFSRPDGTIQVVVKATPGRGPAYTERFEDCPVPDRQQAGVIFDVVTGALRDGTFDVRHDLPLPANSTGQSYQTIHIEQVGRP